MTTATRRRGFSLIELVITIGIMGLLFGAIYLVYFMILDITTSVELRTAAVSILNRQVEVIRNFPYAQVGTVGGVPAGIIPAEQTVLWDTILFTVKTTVRNVDDPFDGTLGGVPNDTAPGDYKLVELQASCPSCTRFAPLSITATAAPKSLEAASKNGSLFVTAIDASGVPISSADVHVVNTSTSPPIDLNDRTNAQGVLALVDVPTSTQNYQITATRSGYSTDRTYPIGDPSNPNPIKPHATVAEGTVTNISFAIDKTSTLAVTTSDAFCAPLGGRNFIVSGSKFVGTSPDVLKFTANSATNGSGTKILSGLEWDTYAATFTSSGDDLMGTMPLQPLLLFPDSSVDFRFVLTPSNPNSLLVTVKDAGTGAGIPNSNLTLAKAGFSETRVSGHAVIIQTDWSSGQYETQDGGIDTNGTPGAITLLQAGGFYSTTTASSLTSKTFDVGGSVSTFYRLAWNPATQPPETGPESLRFQIATNNDGATWNFVGPDGTADTFYSISSTTLPALHANNRYLRYKVFMKTSSETATPTLHDLSIEFSGICVPPAQVLFSGLASGSYSLTAQVPGYQDAANAITVGSGFQSVEIPMTP